MYKTQVVQVYLEWTNATIPVPKIQLVSFRRVQIKAGEHRVVDLEVSADRMAVWEDNKGWTFISGMRVSILHRHFIS